jgi:hypothetical protein
MDNVNGYAGPFLLPSISIVPCTEREARSVHLQVPELHHQKWWAALKDTLGWNLFESADNGD